jgi:hypothetical protein
MSRVDALLASFKQGQRKALQLQAEARQEREEKLAKAAAGGAGGRLASWSEPLTQCRRFRRPRRNRPMPATSACSSSAVVAPVVHSLPRCAAGRGRGRGAGGRGRGGKATSAASGDASASVASAGVTDWRQRSRTAQQATPLGVKLKAIVDFLRARADPQSAQAVAAATGL